MLTQLGYEVCGVPSAAAALAELDRCQDFALLFTDIVLPGAMDGIALSKAVACRAPQIPVLLTSGFSEYNLSQSDLPGMSILMKPYKRQDLLDRLDAITAPSAR
jgi:DNA-binding NtrC family response regulator